MGLQAKQAVETLRKQLLQQDGSGSVAGGGAGAPDNMFAVQSLQVRACEGEDVCMAVVCAGFSIMWQGCVPQPSLCFRVLFVFRSGALQAYQQCVVLLSCCALLCCAATSTGVPASRTGSRLWSAVQRYERRR